MEPLQCIAFAPQAGLEEHIQACSFQMHHTLLGPAHTYCPQLEATSVPLLDAPGASPSSHLQVAAIAGGHGQPLLERLAQPGLLEGAKTLPYRARISQQEPLASGEEPLSAADHPEGEALQAAQLRQADAVPSLAAASAAASGSLGSFGPPLQQVPPCEATAHPEASAAGIASQALAPGGAPAAVPASESKGSMSKPDDPGCTLPPPAAAAVASPASSEPASACAPDLPAQPDQLAIGVLPSSNTPLHMVSHFWPNRIR